MSLVVSLTALLPTAHAYNSIGALIADTTGRKLEAAMTRRGSPKSSEKVESSAKRGSMSTSSSGRSIRTSSGGLSPGSSSAGRGDSMPTVRTDCQDMVVAASLADVQAKVRTFDHGEVIDPFAMTSTASGEPLGFITEANAFLSFDIDTITDMGNNLYSFTDGPDGAVFSQINTAFGVDSPNFMITGGSGAYGCASGNGVVELVSEDRIEFTLKICGPLCPTPQILQPDGPGLV